MPDLFKAMMPDASEKKIHALLKGIVSHALDRLKTMIEKRISKAQSRKNL